MSQMKPIESSNDFVIKFANVNGSGSASANELFARAIMRMGVPVAPRNIFPSNIQGMPTWYEARVCEKGYLGRRGGVDMMVAMNPQTWDADVAEITPGGYLFYDSTRPIPAAKFRPDIAVIGMPLTEISNNTYSDPRQRQLFKNIIYVGALSVLLDVEAEVFEKLFAEQYRGKEMLLDSNVRALHLGRDYAREHLRAPLGIRVRRADEVGDRIFTDGNSAAALGCVYGGATVAAWYPITPSSSVPEAFQKYCDKFRVDPDTGRSKYAIVQAEDELASIGMVVGAGWNGARAFTATSGPGISLMTEFIGLAYFAEIPVTIINVQRGGPSTGMPTRTQQSDLLACAYASHGDTKHVLLFPQDPAECFEFAATALDLADRLQTPVFLMTDLDIGMNQRLTAPFVWDDARQFEQLRKRQMRRIVDARLSAEHQPNRGIGCSRCRPLHHCGAGEAHLQIALLRDVCDRRRIDDIQGTDRNRVQREHLRLHRGIHERVFVGSEVRRLIPDARRRSKLSFGPRIEYRFGNRAGTLTRPVPSGCGLFIAQHH